MQSQVKFNRVVPGRLGAKPSQVQQGSGEGSRKGSGEGLGGFGAEPGQVQQGSGEGSGEGLGGLVQSQVRFNRVPEKVPEKAGSSGRLWCRARSGSTVPEKDWEALVQSQVRFKRLWCRAKSGSTGFRRRFRRRRQSQVKVQQGSGEGSGRRFQEALVQSQVRFSRFPEKVAEKAPEKVLGIFGGGPGQVQQIQQGFQRLASQHASERFVTIKRCGCWDTTEAYLGSFVLLQRDLGIHSGEKKTNLSASRQ